MSPEKKKHHFVPQSYLRGFTIQGEKRLIWEYDKDHCRITKNPKSVRNICYRDYYYEQQPDSQRTQMLEDGFGNIETTAINIIRSLYERKTTITGYEKGTLAYYIALLLTRGPAYRDGCNRYCKFHAEIMLQNAYKSGILPEPPAILRKHIINNDITSAVNAEVLPEASLQPMLNKAKQFGKSLCNKKWNIYFSKDKFFATSDTPVIFGKSYGSAEVVDPADPTSHVFCPLNKYMLLAARPYIKSDKETCDCENADSAMMKLLNQITCYASQRYVYFPEKSDELFEYIKLTQDYSQKLRTYRFGDAIIQTWTVGKNNQRVEQNMSDLQDDIENKVEAKKAKGMW